jgi:hypothetical protein
MVSDKFDAIMVANDMICARDKTQEKISGARRRDV